MSSIPTKFRPALLVIDMQNDFWPPSGSLAVRFASSTVDPINTLLSLPGFVLKLATQDSHPPSHISFASNHSCATTTDGRDARPFHSFTKIANPLNGDEVVESKLWPDHCIQHTEGEQLVQGINWHHLTRIDPDIMSKLNQLYPTNGDEENLGFQYAALPSSSLAILKKGLVPTLEQYSAFTPPFTNPPIHPPPSHTRGNGEGELRSPPLLTCLLQAYAVTHVYVVGLAYDYCVKETALDAVRQGFVAYIVEEGTKAVYGSAGSLNEIKAELQLGGVKILEGGLDGIEEIKWVKNFVPPLI